MNAFWIASTSIALGLGVSPTATGGLSSVEVGKIAKRVTVTIDSPTSPGSGVIVERNGNSYSVLTAAHVVRKYDRQFKVITYNGEEHSIAKIEALKDTDLAVVKFQSKTKYALAKFGDSTQSTEGSIVYVAGFPVATKAISASIYNFTEGKVTANASRPLKDGYSLVYSNNTLPGMSGGPVFNNAGELIAIHGRGDVDESSQASDINSNVRVKTGFNLGIPTAIITKFASNLGLNLAAKTTTIEQAPNERIRNSRPPITSNMEPPRSSPSQTNSTNNNSQSRTNIVRSSPNERIRNSRPPITSNIEPPINNSQSTTDSTTIAALPNADDYFLMGVDRFSRNNWAGAIESMDLAIKINPKYIRAYMARAAANYMSERLGKAIADIDRAIEIDPRSAIAHVGKCFVTNSFGNKGQALGYCDRAIELDPKLSIAYNARGVVNLDLKNYGGANRDLMRAIELDPQSYYAYGNLGLVAYKQNNPLPALQYTRRALALYPRSANTRAQLGEILLATKDYQQAISELNFAIGLNPRLGRAYQARGAAYIALGNTARGQADIRQATIFNRSTSPLNFIEDLSFLNQ